MTERDYVLGTDDAEVQRLGLQHRVWRPRALEGWRDAGFTAGQTLLDVACGPGYATIDLAEIVGPAGRVVAVDQSRRFLSVLERSAAQRGLSNIEVHERNLDAEALPALAADGAWARWIFAFVSRPKELLGRVRAALRPGGTLIVHEYVDYSSWRVAPRSEIFEQFVATVMRSWRASGGEPDIGLDLPGWLDESGFRLRRIRPIIDIITPDNFIWQWPKAFIQTGIDHMLELGMMSAEEAGAIRTLMKEREAAPGTLMITPAVVEIIATAV